MSVQELKLNLIQWILEINNEQTLESLWKWKVKQKEEREKLFFSLCGSWQSDGSGEQLVEEIYQSRIDIPREVEL
jgi:hypothetical protein